MRVRERRRGVEAMTRGHGDDLGHAELPADLRAHHLARGQVEVVSELRQIDHGRAGEAGEDVDLLEPRVPPGDVLDGVEVERRAQVAVHAGEEIAREGGGHACGDRRRLPPA